MSKKVFCSRDNRLSVFNNPFVLGHIGEATRMWEEVVNDEKTMPGKYPDDFSLYEIGEWDEDQGVFTSYETHKLVATAREVKRLPVQEQMVADR